MAFTLEDGTGIADANAFISVAFFRAFHTDRGRASEVDVSVLDDTTVEGLIVRATDFAEKRFGTRYKGSRATDTQKLSFPRKDVTVDGRELPEDAVPSYMEEAIAELALTAAAYARLLPDPPVPFARDDASGVEISGSAAVQRRREKVDVIEEDVTFADLRDVLRRGGTATADGWMIPAYPAAELILEPLLKSGKGTVIR